MNFKYRLTIEPLDTGVPIDGFRPDRSVLEGECEAVELDRPPIEAAPMDGYRMYEPAKEFKIVLHGCKMPEA